jgi:CheY-like chemotaxis protein
MKEMNMKNENYLDAKVVSHSKQEMVKRLQLQLQETHNMLSKPGENSINKQKPYYHERQRSTQSSNSRILVVDDNEDNKQLLESFLDLHGYEFFSASNGHEALTLLQNEDFDLVLTDICMPGVSGNDLAKYIKTHRKALPVIAITGSTWLAKEYFDKVISKPVWLHDLLDLIQFYLAEKPNLSGMVREDRP